MIIDAHCHIWEEHMISDKLLKVIKAIAEKIGCENSLITKVSPEKLVNDMNEAGIDKAMVVALDMELFIESKLTYKEYNDYLASIISKYPDRFIGFAGIDPRRGKDAIIELERCEKMGLKGVKLWPLTGFYPDDPSFYPFYERVQELKLPIFCHTGIGPAYTYLKYNNPVYIDTIAVDFPDIKIIMAHVSQPWVNEALAVAAKNENVYIDISSWQLNYYKVPISLQQTLAQAKIICGIEKILFGTDWPLFHPLISQKEWVRIIKRLKIPPPLQLMGLKDLTDEDKELILGGNVKNLLGL